MHKISGQSRHRDLPHLEGRPGRGRSRSLESRRQDTPWAALLISLLGLVAAIVAARVTQLPANDPPQVLVAPVATDPTTAVEPTTVESAPPPTTPGSDVTPAPTTLRPTTATRTSMSPATKSGTTAPAPTPPTPPTPPAPTTCRSSYNIQSAWNGGMVAKLTLTNTSGRAWTTWSGSFSVSPVTTVQYSWGATMHSADGRVSVTPADYNASVPAGGTVSLGFQVLTTAPTTQFGAFTVNGTTCRSG